MRLDILLVHLDVAVQPGLELLVRHIGTLPWETSLEAGRGILEVSQMGDNVKTEGATVAEQVDGSLADLYIIKNIVDLVGRASGQPVLGSGVAVPEDDGRQTRHGVSTVGNAILGASLVGDEGGKGRVTDSGRAKSVDVHGDAGPSQVRSSDGGHGTAKGVARRNDFEARVRSLSGRDGCLGPGRDLVPGILKTAVDATAGNEVAVVLVKVKIGEPVADIAAAAD